MKIFSTQVITVIPSAHPLEERKLDPHATVQPKHHQVWPLTPVSNQSRFHGIVKHLEDSCRDDVSDGQSILGTTYLAY